MIICRSHPLANLLSWDTVSMALPFSVCLRKKESTFPRNRSRERKSVHRQWSVVCQSLRLRLSSSVGVGLRIFRSPVCNITLVPDPNPRNMQINGFQKRVYPGLPLNRRAIVPCPLPIPAAMPVLVESMQSAYGHVDVSFIQQNAVQDDASFF